MALIGMRELHNRTAEVLRRVREDRDEFIVTHQGRPVALLVPLAPERMETEMLEAAKRSTVRGWDAYARLRDSVRQQWPVAPGTEETLDEIRR